MPYTFTTMAIRIDKHSPSMTRTARPDGRSSCRSPSLRRR
jgi:hypothetical protein